MNSEVQHRKEDRQAPRESFWGKRGGNEAARRKRGFFLRLSFQRERQGGKVVARFERGERLLKTKRAMAPKERVEDKKIRDNIKNIAAPRISG